MEAGSRNSSRLDVPVWSLPKNEQLKFAQHVLIRLPAKLGSADDVVERHRDVILKHGSVWLGRMGRPMGQAKIHELNAQLASDVETRMYITQKFGESRLLYACKIASLSRLGPALNSRNVPPYYTADMIKRITLWAKLTSIEQTPADELTRMHVASSGQTVAEMLQRTRTSCVVVRMGGGIAW